MLFEAIFGCSWEHLGLSCRLLAAFGGLLDPSGTSWEASWCALGASWLPLGGVLGVSWGPLGASWGLLEHLDGLLGKKMGLAQERSISGGRPQKLLAKAKSEQ